MVKTGLTILWVLFLGFGLYRVSAKTQAYGDRDYDVLAPPPLTRLDARLVDVLSFGHRGLYDDVINIWLLQSLLDDRLRQQGPEDVLAAMKRVTDMQPKIESIYMLSCFVMAFDFRRPEKCEQLTLSGMRAMPESWRIPVTQAFISYHELKDAPRAAMYYGLAASRSTSPRFLDKLAKNLLDNNQLSIPELQETLNGLLDSESGSKFGAYLKDLPPVPPKEKS